MKNLLIAIMLILAVATPAMAKEPIDHGTLENGAQCFDEKDENGQCDIVYTGMSDDQYTCIIDTNNWSTHTGTNCIPISPRYSSAEEKRESWRQRLMDVIRAK